MTINARPTAPTAVNGERCGGGTVNISATVSAGETVNWYSTNLSNTVLSIGTTYTTPSIGVTSTYFALAVNTTTNCTSATRTPVLATIFSNSTAAAAGVDQSICGTTATLAANTPTIGTGVWSVVTGAGGSFTDNANPTTTFSGVGGTAYTLRWTTSNGPCVPRTDDVVITLTSLPTGALSGTYYIPTSPLNDCRFFNTIADAVTHLNNNGVSGSVTFQVNAGYTETLSSTLALGSATLNPTTASNKTIRFVKDGAGLNPLVTAYTGGTGTPATSTPDGIWSLNGVDFVTIDGIDLQENGANSGNALMEFGYGLFKVDNNDGAQRDTIRNSTITLNKNNVTAGSANYFPGSVGIAVVNANRSTVTTATTPASSAASNSFNAFLANTIQNVNVGIGLNGGINGSSNADTSNSIGDTSSIALGNTITNLGGGASATSISYGVYLNNQMNPQVSNNSITGAGHTGDQYGIRTQHAAASGIDIKQNSINITGGADKNYYGIDNVNGGTGFTTTIANNTMSVLVPEAISVTNSVGSVTGIINRSATNATTSIQINGNTLSGSIMAGTAPWTGISNVASAAAVGGTISISGNTLANNRIAATGALIGIQHNSTSQQYASLNMSNNIIRDNSKSHASGTAAELSWLRQGTGSGSSNTGNLTIQNNLIVRDTINVTAGNTANVDLNVIFVAGAKTGATIDVSGNTIREIVLAGTNSAFVSNLRGYRSIAIAVQGPAENVVNNKISNLKLSPAANATATNLNVTGIQFANSGVNITRSANNNRIDTLIIRSNGGSYAGGVTGIHYAGNTNAVNVFNNKIAHLMPVGSGANAIARGIHAANASASNLTIHNNMIEVDLNQAFDAASPNSLDDVNAVRGIDISTGGLTYNVYFNTIRLAGSANGANFGGSALFIGSTGPTTVLLRNNALVNNLTPGVTGVVSAIWNANASFGKYSNQSNNNLYYAGLPNAQKVLYYDGTNAYQALSSLQPTREANSRQLVDPAFIRGADNTDSLHMDTLTNCALNGTGIAIGGITADIDGQTRQTPPDIGADEFVGDGLGIGQWNGYSTDWNNSANWCGVIPTEVTDVTITNNRTFYPVIDSNTTPTPTVRNLQVASGGSVTVQDGGVLIVQGNIAQSTGDLNVVNGTIEMAGNTGQTIAAGAFKDDRLKDLIVKTDSVVLNGPLNLLGTVRFIGNNRKLVTNDNLTLKSSDSLTASVADVTNNGANTGNQITGKVTVERYISTIKNGNPSLRTWRYLAMPTKHDLQTIKQSWQENGDSSTVFNPNPGFGTQITSNIGTTNAGVRALGFDAYSRGGSSLLTLDPASNAWIRASTTLAPFDANKPYLVFVRGSRAKTLFADVPDNTTLREKGTLNVGDMPSLTVGSGANQFVGISNPYASPIDFEKVDKSGLTDGYYLLEPRLAINGAFVVATNGFITPPTPTYQDGNPAIQSSQAFIVRTNGTGNGTINFRERDKDLTVNTVAQRRRRPTTYMRTNLWRDNNGNLEIFDGTLHLIDSTYASDLDDFDAEKLLNFGENFGIGKGNNRQLIVESRTRFVENDTVYYQIGQLARSTNYKVELAPQNVQLDPGVLAFFEDTYLNTKTPVNMSETFWYNFTVNNQAASFNKNRFRLVFTTLRPVPVSILSVTAVKKDNQSLIEWKVGEELNVDRYEVEHSVNGTAFTKIGSVQATQLSAYQFMHAQPVLGNNYYRIRSVDQNGAFKFSQIVKLNFTAPPIITMYPNPIKEDRKATIRFDRMPEGTYMLRLINAAGQVVQLDEINHTAAMNQHGYLLNQKLSRGSYTLEITSTATKKIRIKVIF